MTQFFVDFKDPDLSFNDDEGIDLPSLDHARDQVKRMLSQAAKDRLPDGEDCQFVATVRDENGRLLYRATLRFQGERLS